jgi:MFS family permease
MAITAAGLAYACMQGGGMLGRILIGWVADRTGDALRNMIVQAWASAALAVVWAVVPQGTGLAAIAPLAFAMGLVCASWPGLMLAEISRLAPAGRIADAASGSTLITFCGYVAGPMLFSFGVRASGGWVVPYAAVAAQMALVAAGLGLWARRRRAA